MYTFQVAAKQWRWILGLSALILWLVVLWRQNAFPPLVGLRWPCAGVLGVYVLWKIGGDIHQLFVNRHNLRGRSYERRLTPREEWLRVALLIALAVVLSWLFDPIYEAKRQQDERIINELTKFCQQREHRTEAACREEVLERRDQEDANAQ